MQEDKDLKEKISNYVYQRYSGFIKGETIVYGKAMFPVEMLISGSVDTCKMNPQADIHYVVDYMFEYFCN